MNKHFQRIVESKSFNRFIILVIVAAAVLIGLETSPDLVQRHGHLLHLLDKIILGIFTIEIILKMAAHGKQPWRYFKDGWNVFDFTIVAVCFLPMNGQFAAVLRLARILRVLRLVTAVPRLQLLVGALLKSIPSMLYVSVLLFILFYIYAVIGVFVFSKHDPAHFDSIGHAMLSLFQIITMEGWVDLLNAQMFGPNSGNGAGGASAMTTHGLVAVVYFISFILLGTMIMLNLFIGVIMKSMGEVEEETAAADRARHKKEFGAATLTDEIRRLEHQLDGLKESLRAVLHRAEQEAARKGE